MTKRKLIFCLGIMTALLITGCNSNIQQEEDNVQSEEIESTVLESGTEEADKKLMKDVSEESTDGKLDVKEIKEYGAFDENIIDCIRENILLRKDTQVKDICWVDEVKSCLRVKIQYKENQEEMDLNHLEDYFFFVEENDIEVLYVDYQKDFGAEKIKGGDFEAHLEDVNFDGQEDLIIALGYNDVMYVETYCAYLNTDNGYEYCPSFEKVSYNYCVDNDNKCIISTSYSYADNGMVEEKHYYEFRENEFCEIDNSQNLSKSIRDVKVIDNENYILKCITDDGEYTLSLIENKAFDEVGLQDVANMQLVDLTGDGKNDLVINILAYGNTACETLASTYVYTVSENGLEEILCIDAFGEDGIQKWDDRYVMNCGYEISKDGELIVDVMGSKVDGVIESEGVVFLKYEDGNFNWVKTIEDINLLEYMNN